MTCKDCIHFEVCDSGRHIGEYIEDDGVYSEGVESECPAFKNKSRFIELPFSVGNKVYPIIVDDGSDEGVYICEETVTGKGDAGVWVSTCEPPEDDCSALWLWSDFGVEVFTTYEEAKENLNRRCHHGNGNMSEL